MYIIVEALYCICEISIMLYVNYGGILKINLKKKIIFIVKKTQYIKAGDSTLVYAAKVVLPANNLVCCFNIPFFLSPSHAACRL